MATNAGGSDVEAPVGPTRRRHAGQPSLVQLFAGGFAGTVGLMAVVFLLEPSFMGRNSNLARAIGAEMGDPHRMGLIVFHLFTGSIVFPLGFAFFATRVPAPWLVKGLIWGLILWMLAGLFVMPMSGFGFFGYNVDGLRAVASSLTGHLAYGGLQGAIAGIPRREPD